MDRNTGQEADMGSDVGLFGSYSRIKKIRTKISAFKANRRWPLERISEEAQVGRKTLSNLLRGKGGTPHEETLNKLDTFLAKQRNDGGFNEDKTYEVLANSFGASLENEEFINKYAHEYRVVRAHVPTRKALISSLEIEAGRDTMVVRYRHRLVVTDGFSIYGAPPQSENFENNENTDEQLIYEGFVFNCDKYAILLAPSLTTRHMKQLTINLPDGVPSHSMQGLVLTVSAKQRELFSARVIVERFNKNFSEERKKLWSPGLKEWTALPEMVQAEFSAKDNYGLLLPLHR